MKKTTKIIVMLVSLVVLGILGVMAYYFIIFYMSFELGPGKDHYCFLDENERYEMLDLGELVLSDEERNIGLASCIEKYVKEMPYIYILEGSCFSTGGTKDGVIYYYDRDPNSGEMIAYTDPSEIPLYMVINYETGEAVKYMSLDEMPEEIRLVFEEPLTEECLKDRTCYEAD